MRASATPEGCRNRRTGPPAGRHSPSPMRLPGGSPAAAFWGMRIRCLLMLCRESPRFESQDAPGRPACSPGRRRSGAAPWAAFRKSMSKRQPVLAVPSCGQGCQYVLAAQVGGYPRYQFTIAVDAHHCGRQVDGSGKVRPSGNRQDACANESMCSVKSRSGVVRMSFDGGSTCVEGGPTGADDSVQLRDGAEIGSRGTGESRPSMLRCNPTPGRAARSPCPTSKLGNRWCSSPSSVMPLIFRMCAAPACRSPVARPAPPGPGAR